MPSNVIIYTVGFSTSSSPIDAQPEPAPAKAENVRSALLLAVQRAGRHSAAVPSNVAPAATVFRAGVAARDSAYNSSNRPSNNCTRGRPSACPRDGGVFQGRSSSGNGHEDRKRHNCDKCVPHGIFPFKSPEENAPPDQ